MTRRLPHPAWRLGLSGNDPMAQTDKRIWIFIAIIALIAVILFRRAHAVSSQANLPAMTLSAIEAMATVTPPPGADFNQFRTIPPLFPQIEPILDIYGNPVLDINGNPIYDIRTYISGLNGA